MASTSWTHVLFGAVVVAALVAAIYRSVRRAAKEDARLTPEQLTQRDKDDAW